MRINYDWVEEMEPWNMDYEYEHFERKYFRTRSFVISNQCEIGYVFEFKPEIQDSIMDELGMNERIHWSDPVYWPA